MLKELFERVLTWGSANRPPKTQASFVEAPTYTQADPVRQRYIERRGFIIADLITAYLPEAERFTVLDGGAREALADTRWQVFDPKRMRLHGFEPDEKEVRELNALASQRGLDYRYHSGALWGEPSEQTFYENKAAGGGSFFLQNTELTNRWKFENHDNKFLSSEIFYPTGTARWRMTSLDAWVKSQNEPIDIDFMKLNVQGAELEILRGSSRLVEKTIGLMVEVSFVESYKNRPFFADIDSHLRQKGFVFFDLIGHHYIGRAASPVTVRHLPGLYPLWGQLIEGHGVYFRDPISDEAKGGTIDHLTTPKLLKLVAFAEVFGQIEFAFELLDWTSDLLERRNDSAGAEEVRQLRHSAKDRYHRYMI
jgi:FkbM family methyltransferase